MSELPAGVELVAMAKNKQAAEILEAIEAGAKIIGENYLQEAERAYKVVGDRVKWHLTGHLQRNKVKKAVRIFDMIETVDSIDIAREIDKRCAEIGKIMPVLIEVNSGRERQKTGVLPGDVAKLVKDMAGLTNIRVLGLMTIEPYFSDPENSRPYFAETRRIFEEIRKLNIPNVEMKHLSMGMSNSYKVAIEEGANMVRIGTRIFGARNGLKEKGEE